MKQFLLSWLLLAAVTPVLGQTAAPADLDLGFVVPAVSTDPDPVAVPAVPVIPPPIKYQPSYFLMAGASYDYYGSTSATLTTFGARIADRTYALTSLDLFSRNGSSAAGLRTGVGRILAQPGNWNLMALGDGGILKTEGRNLGNFSTAWLSRGTLASISVRITYS